MEAKTRREIMLSSAAALAAAALYPIRAKAAAVHPLEKKIGRIFFLNMYWKSPPDFFLRHIENYQLGGAYLDKNAFKTKETCKRATARLRSAAQAPLFIITDCEGGGVNRAREVAPFVSAGEIGSAFASGKLDEKGVYNEWAKRAKLLSELGLDFNFDPVLDLTGPYIGKRAFSPDPQTVAKIAGILVNAYRDHKVHSTAKHFPGMGTVKQDPHQPGLPSIKTPLDKLMSRELVPFKAAIDAGVSSIMIGHPYLAAIDAKLPASLSPDVHAFVRKDLGFKGVVWPDSLSMGMIERFYAGKGLSGFSATARACQDAIKAGVDLIFNYRFDIRLFPALVKSMRSAVEDGRIPQKRIDEANARAEALHQLYR